MVGFGGLLLAFPLVPAGSCRIKLSGSLKEFLGEVQQDCSRLLVKDAISELGGSLCLLA